MLSSAQCQLKLPYKEHNFRYKKFAFKNVYVEVFKGLEFFK